MDLEAERIQEELPARAPRHRTTFGWFTAVIVVVSGVFTVFGLRFGLAAMEREPATALLGSGPTTVEPAEPAGSVSGSDREAPPSASPSTTTIADDARTGAAASSLVPSGEGSGVDDPAPGRSPQERGEWALHRIDYPWEDRLPGWTVDFHDGRDGLFGLTMVDDKRIEIYVRDDQSDDLLVHIVAHELGHAVDVTLNSGDDRRRWQAVRGIEDEPWWPSSAASDFQTGAGDFAESFAFWQARSDNYRSKLGSAPTDTQLEVMAELAGG